MTLYALDSTTIDLCLSLFPRAKFRQHKAAVKIHTLLDLLTTSEAAWASYPGISLASSRAGMNNL